MKKEKRSFPVHGLRAIDGKTPKITGHLPFNSLSHDLGGFKEIILPGSMTDTIQDDKILAFWGHNAEKPIGSTQNQSLILSETRKGLDIEIFPDLNVSWSKDAYFSVKNKTTTGLSFGFSVLQENMTSGGIRELEKIKLFEMSIVAMQAYPAATVQARNLKGKKIMSFKNINMAVRALLEIGENVLDEDRTHPNEDENKQMMDAALAYGAMAPTQKPEAPLFFRDGYEAVKRFWNKSQYEPIRPDLNPGGGFDKTRNNHDTEERAFRSFVQHGFAAMPESEKRALAMDEDLKGGFAVMPQEMQKKIIKEKDKKLFVRQYATKFTVEKAESMGAPELSPDASDGEWTSELATGTSDSTMGFKKRVIYPHPLTKKILVSKKLKRASYLDFPNFIIGRLNYRIKVAEENSFLNSEGVNSPLGIFCVSDDGVPASRDVSTGNTSTSIKFDGLIEAENLLEPEYRDGARWVFNKDAAKGLRKLKSGDGDYIWTPSLLEKQPNLLLGYPIDLSFWCPSTFAASQYVGALCNWGLYWIVDALTLELQVLIEKYAETNQDMYIIRSETDGSPIDANGFVRVKLS